MILDALIEFFLFLIEGAFHLFWWGDQSHRASLLDRSPQERRVRRHRIGLGCLVMLFLTAVAIAIILMAK